MEEKRKQNSSSKSDLTTFMIKNLEMILEEEPMNGKKKEILDLVEKHNKLSSKEEYDEVFPFLDFAFSNCDFELIKILLSETVGNISKELKFKLDEKNKTALLFQINDDVEEIIIPRTFQHESSNYLITSIMNFGKNVKTIKFVEDSAVKIIYKTLFLSSKLEEIYIPASLIELQHGWCTRTYNLKKIIISPFNSRFKFVDDKYLLSKSDPNSDEFDILLFARRDCKEIFIPSNIKIISSYAFCNCQNMTKVEFSTDSNLQIIDSHAFIDSGIEEISIPSTVKIISSHAFYGCGKLTKVEIPSNSNLQTIGDSAFSFANIKEFSISLKVSKICEYAFECCRNLTKVFIPTNSTLQSIGKRAFAYSNIKEIYFPSSLKELGLGWSFGSTNLSKIMISPSNNHFYMKENKILLSKSDENSDDFDTLLLCLYNTKKISIPSNIRIIESYSFVYSRIKSFFIPPKVKNICKKAFLECRDLLIIEISEESELESFSIWSAKIIMVPASFGND